MKEISGSIWLHFLVPNHFVCITTNGTIKNNGEAVMGRGNAKQATITIPNVKKLLGNYLQENGNVAGYLDVLTQTKLVIFPVKHEWWEEADLELISKSTKWLYVEALGHPERIYHLPRPGCGNGLRDWEKEVKPTSGLLLCPDNVLIHHLHDEKEEPHAR